MNKILSLIFGIFILTNLVNTSFAATVWISSSNNGAPVVISTAWAFKPSVSIANSGEYVVAWVKDGVVEAKIYNRDDSLKGSTITIDSTWLSTENSRVLVKMDPISWNWVVVYNKKPTGWTDVDLYYKVYWKDWSNLLSATSLSADSLNQRVMFLDYSPLDEIYTVAYASEYSSDVTKEQIYVAQIINNTFSKTKVWVVASSNWTDWKYAAGVNHSFFVPVKNSIATNDNWAYNWHLYKYVYDSNSSKYLHDWRTMANFNLAEPSYTWLSDNNVYQNVNNKFWWYSSKGLYSITAGQGSCNYSASRRYNNYFFRQGTIKSWWFYLRNSGWAAYYTACGYGDIYRNSSVVPSISKVNNLFNWWLIGVFAPRNDNLYREINVVYWDGIEGSNPSTVTYNLLWNADETISAIDVNLYWKIITVKGD